MTIRYQDLNIENGKQSILHILSLATKQEISNGLTWYNRAHEFCIQLASNYDLSLGETAGIIAALSPGTHWQQNMIDSVNLLTSGLDAKVTTYNRNKYKAWAISQGILDPYDALSQGKNGIDKKTFCFWLNLVGPNTAGRVTIDRHSSRVAYGYNLSADIAIYYSNTPKKYKACELAYNEASRDANIALLPHQIQAITWLTYRRLYVTRKRSNDWLDYA